MQSPRRRFVRATTVTATLAAAGAIALACSVHSESPTAITPKPPQHASSGPYVEFQVEKQAAPMPDNPAPRYPDALRAANVEGSVRAEFVINPDGTPDMSSFKVLSSTDQRFTDAVKQTLATWKFYPAKVGDRAVRQLLTLPFVFSLAKCDSCSNRELRR